MAFEFTGKRFSGFAFKTVGVGATLALVGVFAGTTTQPQPTHPPPDRSFSFTPCHTHRLFAFPISRKGCGAPVKLPLAGQFNGEVLPSTITLGSLGGVSRRTDFTRIQQHFTGFVFKPTPHHLTTPIGRLDGEFTLIHEPNSATISHKLKINGTLSATSKQQVIGVLSSVLQKPYGTINANNVPEGRFTHTLSLTASFSANLLVSGSMAHKIPLHAKFKGENVPVGGFNNIIGVRGGFIGVIASNEAIITHTIAPPNGAFHVRNFDWGKIPLLYSQTCSRSVSAKPAAKTTCLDTSDAIAVDARVQSTQDNAIVDHNMSWEVSQNGKLVVGVSCEMIDGAVSLHQSSCAVSEQASPTYSSKCLFVDTASPLLSTSCMSVEDGLPLWVGVCVSVDDTAQFVQREVRDGYTYDPSKVADHKFVFPHTYDGFTFNGVVKQRNMFVSARKAHLSTATCNVATEGLVTKAMRCSDVEEAINPPQGYIKPTHYDPVKPPIIIDTTRVNKTIPNQEVYIVNTDISAHIKGTNIEIPFDGIGLTYSPSAISWQMSASLQGGSIVDALKPNEDTGEPVELDIIVNGTHWTMLVEEISRSRSHNDKRVGVVCSGLSSRLGDNYTAPESFVIDTPLTTQQIARQILDVSWDLDWQMAAWLIPANTFSSMNTSPIQALAKLVAGCGGVLIPSRTSKKLTVRSAYSTLPWLMPTATPNYTFSEDIVTSVVEVSETDSSINGVFIHGAQPNGVVGKVVKYGSAGDVLGTTIHNKFATNEMAVRHLGEQFMAKHINRPKIKQFEIPLDSSQFPLMETGDLIKLTISPSDTNIPDGEHTVFDTVYGCVNSVSVSVSNSEKSIEAYQTISLGDHDMSILSTFQSLIPRSTTSIGVVKFVTGTLCKVELIGGGIVSVEGVAGVGKAVYVRDGRIEGTLPALTLIPETVVG